MQVVTRAALMREVMRNVWQRGIVVSCRSVTLGPAVPVMSQSCSPAVCGGAHSFSLSQGPGGSWILFSVSPWWKSKSTLLVLPKRSCAIGVIEWVQHPRLLLSQPLPTQLIAPDLDLEFIPVGWGSCSASPAITAILLEDGKCLFA